MQRINNCLISIVQAAKELIENEDLTEEERALYKMSIRRMAEGIIEICEADFKTAPENGNGEE
ncbi:MAG TPA: hypothetical protein VNM22_19855 [Candidatus Limnocylindrales bacterium]|nr:hypothetical protein [Candidatus Limnocylindrales bacterium]